MSSTSGFPLDARRLSRVVLILLVCLCASSVLRPQAALRLDGLGRATLPIGGPWQFHTGDNPAWASPAFDDSSWSTIETGRAWEGQGYRNYTGFAWYRRRVALPENLAPGWDLALSLRGVQDAAEVYWNGRLIGSYGALPPHAVWYDRNPLPLVLTIGPAASEARQAVIAMRVWKAPYAYLSWPDAGGLVVTPQIGDRQALEAAGQGAEFAWLHANLFRLGITLLSGVVSLLALLSWIRDRREWMLFWLSIYTIRPLLLLVTEGMPWRSWRIGYGAVGMIYAGTDAALWFLLLYLLGLRGNLRLLYWTRILAVFTLATQVLEGTEQFFDWTLAPRFFLAADVGLTVPSLLVQVWAIVLIVVALRKRLDAARWMVAIFGMLTDAIGNSVSWFDLGNRWTHWTVADTITAPLFTIDGNPFNVLTIASTLLLVSIVYAVWGYEREQRRRQNHLDEEFRNAQEVQRILIPEDLPALPGFAITTAYRPAQEVGGDFFQLIPLPENRALLVLGDVSGKGLHAAMTVALIVGAVRSAAETTDDPAEILAALNRRLHGRLRHGFATCLVSRLDADGRCTLANAGHLPPWLNGREVELPPALPLGLVPEADFEQRPLQLAPGDQLALFTDGLLEARDAAGELFGFERVAGLLAQLPDAARIADAAQKFGQEDDITVLTLSLVPAAVPAS